MAIKVEEPVKTYPCKVKNVYNKVIFLESGPIEIDQIGLATLAEVQSLSPIYIKVV